MAHTILNMAGVHIVHVTTCTRKCCVHNSAEIWDLLVVNMAPATNYRSPERRWPPTEDSSLHTQFKYDAKQLLFIFISFSNNRVTSRY